MEPQKYVEGHQTSQAQQRAVEVDLVLLRGNNHTSNVRANILSLEGILGGHRMKTKPKIILDYCYTCDNFGEVARDGHMNRGICATCAGRLLQAFNLNTETKQMPLFATPAVRRSLRGGH